MTTNNSFSSDTAVEVQNLFETIFNALGETDLDLSGSAAFKMAVETLDGKSVSYRITPLDKGFAHRPKMVLAENLDIPQSGGADFDGEAGTAILVASTVDVTVPDPADGGDAVPVGSTIYATVTSSGGVPKLLSAVRVDESTIRISSPGSGFGALLASAGVDGTLVSGTVDILLSSAALDQLAVVLKTSGGTPGVLSVKRKSATEVTVQSWLAGTGIQTSDTSVVTAYNFGQAAHETSTVRWVVIRP